MYRLLEVRCVTADDSSLSGKTFDRTAVLSKTLDLEGAAPTLRVAPGDSDTQVILGTVASGKMIAVYADYPIKVRFNGSSATQFTLNTSNVPVVNNGAPLPPCCFIGGTFNVTSLYVAPITSAAQTANVWVCVAGDPLDDYT